GGTYNIMTAGVVDKILSVIEDFEKWFASVSDWTYSLQSVMATFKDIRQVTRQQSRSIVAVEMPARTCGIRRDITWSHPDQCNSDYSFEPVVLETGDVLARGLLRVKEVNESINLISGLISDWRNQPAEHSLPDYKCSLRPDSFALSLAEGWRGEICH